MELAESMEQQGVAAEDGNIPMCTRHGKVREFYCIRCDVVICTECMLEEHQGADHYCEKAEINFDAKKREIQQCLEMVCQMMGQIENSYVIFDAEVNRVKEQAAGIKNEIDQFILELHRRLDIAKDNLLNNVDRLQRQKLIEIEHKRKAVETVLFQLTSCKDYVKDKLDNGTPLQVMAIKRKMTSYMRAATLHANLDDADKLIIKKDVLHFDANRSVCDKVGRLFYIHIKDCKIHKTEKIGICNQNSSFYISVPHETRLPQHGFVSCYPLSNPHTFVTAKLRKLNDERYQVKLYPTATGPHRVNVEIGDEHIQGSPFMFHVLPEKHISRYPIRTLRFRGRPITLATRDDGSTIVGEQVQDKCISILDAEGNRVHSFGSRGHQNNQLGNVFQLAVTSNNGGYIILDRDNNSLKKFTAEGNFHINVQRDDFQFRQSSMAISNFNNRVFIIDFNAFRIHAFDVNLTHVGSYTRDRNQRRSLFSVKDIAIDSKGHLFILCYLQQVICKIVFQDNNRFNVLPIMQIMSPIFMAFNKLDAMYIMQEVNAGDGRRHCHSLSVYDCSAIPVDVPRQLGAFTFSNNCSKRILRCPTAMTFDDNGYLYISSYYEGTITVH
jgi:archaellum component FlaC